MLTTKTRDEQELKLDDVEMTTQYPSRSRYYATYDSVNGYVSQDEREAMSTQTEEDDEPSSALKKIKESQQRQNYDEMSPNLLPSQATLKTVKKMSRPEFSQFQKEEQVVAHVTRKGKAIIAIYATAIVALFLIVIFNAIAIMNLSADMGSLENEVASKNEFVSDLYNNLNTVVDNDNLIDRADELNMGSGSGTLALNGAAPFEKVTNENKPASNWFDWLCDLFSFGN